MWPGLEPAIIAHPRPTLAVTFTNIRLCGAEAIPLPMAFFPVLFAWEQQLQTVSANIRPLCPIEFEVVGILRFSRRHGFRACLQMTCDSTQGQVFESVALTFRAKEDQSRWTWAFPTLSRQRKSFDGLDIGEFLQSTRLPIKTYHHLTMCAVG